MNNGAIWISEAEVTGLVTPKDAHGTLEQALRLEGLGLVMSDNET